MMLFSIFVSMTAQTAVTIRMEGTIARVMKVSFHWTANATIKAEKKVEVAWMVRPSFSDIPWLTRLPLVVTEPETEPDSGESK